MATARPIGFPSAVCSPSIDTARLKRRPVTVLRPWPTTRANGNWGGDETAFRGDYLAVDTGLQRQHALRGQLLEQGRAGKVSALRQRIVPECNEGRG